jgi:ComF family protein
VSGHLCLNKVSYHYAQFVAWKVSADQFAVMSYLSSNGLLILLENTDLSKRMVHFVKYNFITDIFSYLKPKFIEYFYKNPLKQDFYVLVPVPLHSRRLLERGFNQSEIICNIISSFNKVKINSKLIKKIKYNHHQVGLDAHTRHSNIVGSFKLDHNFLEDYNKQIIIVDDVYTTGSTLEECARILKENGYKNVWGLVLIRS